MAKSYLLLLLFLLSLLFLSMSIVEGGESGGKNSKHSKKDSKSKSKSKADTKPKSKSKVNSKPADKKKIENSSPKTKGAKDWKKVNLDSVEKDWEDGDEEDELENEYERLKRIQQSKMPRIDPNDPKSMQDLMKKDQFAMAGGGGGSMIFVDLKPKMLSGSDWNKQEVDNLAAKWAHLIRTGSLAATVYNIDERQILFNVERAWMTKDVMKFISMQPEVESFTLQNKKYTAADFEDDDDL